MTCRQHQRLLSPYLDNVLTSDERRNVLNHLSQCAVCAEHLRQLQSNRQLLRTLPTAEVTDAMELRLQAKVQSSKFKVQSQKETGDWRLETRPSFSPSSLKPQASSLSLWWWGWRGFSLGTFATCAASLMLYFSTLQAPPEVSAEEVVSSMDQLLDVLDPDEGTKILTEEVVEEAEPDWHQEIDQWFGDYESNEN